MLSTVRSEKTTPQPKVTPGGLRSKSRSRGSDRAASSRWRNRGRPGPRRRTRSSPRKPTEVGKVGSVTRAQARAYAGRGRRREAQRLPIKLHRRSMAQHRGNRTGQSPPCRNCITWLTLLPTHSFGGFHARRFTRSRHASVDRRRRSGVGGHADHRRRQCAQGQAARRRRANRLPARFDHPARERSLLRPRRDRRHAEAADAVALPPRPRPRREARGGRWSAGQAVPGTCVQVDKSGTARLDFAQPLPGRQGDPGVRLHGRRSATARRACSTSRSPTNGTAGRSSRASTRAPPSPASTSPASRPRSRFR